jgi:hypothetical protein
MSMVTLRCIFEKGSYQSILWYGELCAISLEYPCSHSSRFWDNSPLFNLDAGLIVKKALQRRL